MESILSALHVIFPAKSPQEAPSAWRRPPCGRTRGWAYEEGDDLDEDERAFNDSLLPKMLVDLPGGGIRADTVVEVDDFAQRFEVKIIVQHKEDWDEEKDPDGYTLKGEIPSAAAEETAVAAENGARGKRPLEEGGGGRGH
eukprot:jgi/Tetstr1/421340/TSEL_012310.t1